MVDISQVLVPASFYGIGAIVYSVSSLIALFVGFSAFRAYRISNLRQFSFLALGFSLLGMAFLSLTVASMYTYFYVPHFIGPKTSLIGFNEKYFTAYYIIAIFAYMIIASIYLPELSKKMHVLYVPLWYAVSTQFHIFSSIILMFILFRILTKKKTLDSFLVSLGFLSITGYHIILMFAGFSEKFFFISHGLLVLGFLLILMVLLKVKRK